MQLANQKAVVMRHLRKLLNGLGLCCWLTATIMLSLTPAAFAQATKPPATTPPKKNLELTDPIAQELCNRVLYGFYTRSIQGHCFINELGDVNAGVEQVALLKWADQGQMYAITSALGLMSQQVQQFPKIGAREIKVLRAEAGDIKVLLYVRDALACLEGSTNIEAISLCLAHKTQRY